MKTRKPALFFSGKNGTQVRITGIVQKISKEVAMHIFNPGPLDSQLGALISPQSQVIESREWLEKKYDKLSVETKEADVHRPEYWGGYIVKPVIIEFWQGRKSRLHDRIQYTLEENGKWKIERLAP